MRTRIITLSVLSAAVFGGCAFDVQSDSDGRTREVVGDTKQALTPIVSASDLAFHFAPFHTQDVNKATMSGKPDYLSKFNYDGDFKGTNNWDDLGAFNTESFAYYAVSENTTHFFIYYQFYHPRDWGTSFAEEHENDSEGALMFIRKDGSQFGRFEGMITQAHGDFLPYRDPSVNLTPGPKGKTVHTVESIIRAPFENFGRPMTYQEWGGHGFYACGSHITNCVRADDGIQYIPTLSSAGIPPATIPNGQQVPVSYRLIDITKPGGLMAHAGDTNAFTDRVHMRGDKSGGCGGSNFDTLTCAENSAGAIWGWNSQFDHDPAGFVKQYFNFGSLPAPSGPYVRNVFSCGHDPCETGAAMPPGDIPCTSCTGTVCAADPFCCSNAWDEVCVAEVSSLCGLSCNACAHDVCQAGAALTRGCNHCASEVCAVDPFCCNNGWDSICVSEAKSVCELCP